MVGAKPKPPMFKVSTSQIGLADRVFLCLLTLQPLAFFDSMRLTTTGITVGGYTLGCFFGAVATIWLGNMLGRRWTIFTGSSIMIIGATLQCSSFEIGQLIAARLITGFGNGMASLRD